MLHTRYLYKIYANNLYILHTWAELKLALKRADVLKLRDYTETKNKLLKASSGLSICSRTRSIHVIFTDIPSVTLSSLSVTSLPEIWQQCQASHN